MANETGKRYVCSNCGSEMLVTRGGDGAITCCGQPMQLRVPAQAQPRPAAQEGQRG